MKLNKTRQVNQPATQAGSVAPLTICGGTGDLKECPVPQTEYVSRMPDKVVSPPRMSRVELEALAIDATNGLKGLVVFCEHLGALADSNKLEEPLRSLFIKATRLARDILGVNETLLYNINMYDNECCSDGSGNAHAGSACHQGPELLGGQLARGNCQRQLARYSKAPTTTP